VFTSFTVRHVFRHKVKAFWSSLLHFWPSGHTEPLRSRNVHTPSCSASSRAATRTTIHTKTHHAVGRGTRGTPSSLAVRFLPPALLLERSSPSGEGTWEQRTIEIADCLSRIRKEQDQKHVRIVWSTPVRSYHSEGVPWAYFFRQSFWRFVLHHYTSAPVIAILDDDACLIAPVSAPQFFTEQVKPGGRRNDGHRCFPEEHVQGLQLRVRAVTPHHAAWSFRGGTERIFGQMVFVFMTDLPLLVWRQGMVEFEAFL
ncbi:unnamed protein product, partial [Amoebophrya sp. A25]